MKLHFLGGASKVTGSCFVLELNDTSVMIDCGVEQEQNLSPAELREVVDSLPSVDCIVLTHAHLDHSGLIPLMVKKKKTGKVISTPATKALCKLLFFDFAKVSKESFGESVYTEEDIASAFLLWDEKDGGTGFELGGARIQFYNNSHILGSVSVFIQTDSCSVLFSGDVGTKMLELMDYPPQVPDSGVDYLVLESTYGDKTHEPQDKPRLMEIVQKVCQSGGKVLIPAFAIGRLQEVLYALRKVDYPIYVDTPLGSQVTELMEEYAFYLKKSLKKRILSGDFDLFSNCKVVTTQRQSKLLAESKDPCVVISASGMLQGGRVLNHFEKIKNDPKSAIVFVGYQAQNTLGARVLSGSERVECQVYKLNCFSAHADKSELIDYVFRLRYLPYKVFLVHGEQEQRQALAEEFSRRKIRVAFPENGSTEEFTVGTASKVEFCDFSFQFAEFDGWKVAPFVGWILEKDSVIKVASDEWFRENVYKKKAAEVMKLITQVSQPATVQETVSMGMDEIEKNIKELVEYRILTKGRAREYLKQFIGYGPDSAKNLVITIHKKKNWHRERCSEDREQELFELAYRTLIALADYPSQDVIRILEKHVGIDIRDIR